MTDALARSVQMVQRLIFGLLDANYKSTAGAAIEAIAQAGQSPRLRRSYDALLAEADRLSEVGERLTPDNPVLRTMLSDLDRALAADEVLMQTVSSATQEGAVRIATQTAPRAATGLTVSQLESVGVRWAEPSIEAVNRIVGYAQSDAFAESVDRLSSYVLDTIRQQAVYGMAYGRNPRTVARDIVKVAQELPVSQASSIMRTLQVTSYREADVASRVANADILEYAVRVSALKTNTCMACIALHGSRLEIDERVDDHNNGLCTSIVKVKGLRAIETGTGERWFANLPKAEQERHMGASRFRAYEAGKLQLRDFVGEYEHQVYGRQVVERSLKGMLGATEATTYYSVA